MTETLIEQFEQAIEPEGFSLNKRPSDGAYHSAGTTAALIGFQKGSRSPPSKPRRRLQPRWNPPCSG